MSVRARWPMASSAARATISINSVRLPSTAAMAQSIGRLHRGTSPIQTVMERLAAASASTTMVHAQAATACVFARRTRTVSCSVRPTSRRESALPEVRSRFPTTTTTSSQRTTPVPAIDPLLPSSTPVPRHAEPWRPTPAWRTPARAASRSRWSQTRLRPTPASASTSPTRVVRPTKPMSISTTSASPASVPPPRSATTYPLAPIRT